MLMAFKSKYIRLSCNQSKMEIVEISLYMW